MESSQPLATTNPLECINGDCLSRGQLSKLGIQNDKAKKSLAESLDGTYVALKTTNHDFLNQTLHLKKPEENCVFHSPPK